MVCCSLLLAERYWAYARHDLDLSGAPRSRVVADHEGAATIDVVLDGRTIVHITPAA
jgi:hypothetical protein